MNKMILKAHFKQLKSDGIISNILEEMRRKGLEDPQRFAPGEFDDQDWVKMLDDILDNMYQSEDDIHLKNLPTGMYEWIHDYMYINKWKEMRSIVHDIIDLRREQEADAKDVMNGMRQSDFI